ncbi:2-dehydropantoate 2-reductase [SAR202 cluster bacterium AC-647-N09_OGT_505m]|nr:2-dehydropantoate 2-reductase [SAR202 cluster bacterium AC-647-N09_OGT_505m]
MRIVIYGAGAIGAFLGAKLALGGEDVILVARGPHLRAIQSHGIRIRSPQGDIQAHLQATDDPTTIGPVDYLFLTVKAHSLTAIAPQLAQLLGPETTVVSAQNGIPWWYFQRHGGQWDGANLESVDPGGVISKTIDASRIIGCVVYPAARIAEPGIIEHTEGDRFSIGELDGASSERCKQLSAALIRAGLKGPIRSRIRHELWVKLLGNMAFNPLSAITRATMVEIATHPETSTIARAMMAEADSIARELGVEIPITIEQRFSGAKKVGHHKTSMLQDLEAGRSLELESIVGSVVELGDKLGLPVPHTRTVYACVKLLITHTGNSTSPYG